MADPLITGPIIAQGVGALVGGIQSLIGGGQERRANRRLKRLFSQRKAFQTPEEVFELLNLTQSNAAQGFSDETLGFLEGGASRGLAASLGTATRLGADPNQLSGVLDTYFQDIFKIGTENELVKMKKFDDFSNAVRTVAQNKEAEQISRDNLIKDQMQAEAQKVAAGQTNVNSGLNLAFNALTSLFGGNLYGGGNNQSPVPALTGVNTAPYTATTIPQRRLDLSVGSTVGNYSR